MERGPSDGDQRRPQARRKSRRAASDDCGQLDNIIGGFGRYQFMIFMFKILFGATSAFNNLGITFFAPTDYISFWCADPPSGSVQLTPATLISTSNLTALSYDQGIVESIGGGQLALAPSAEGLVTNISEALLTGHHVQYPPPTSSIITGNIRQLLSELVSSNERSIRKQTFTTSDTPRNLRKECHYPEPEGAIGGSLSRRKCASFKYDTGIWISTIIDEWDLVCDRSLFISMTQSLYMAGFIVAYLSFGYISDRFGRWNSLILGALIECLAGLCCALAGSIGSFMAFRFLLGLGNAGRSSSSYLIMIEWTGQSWRMHISTLGSLGWAFGYCILPWLVLFFLNFRHMQLFVCCYEIIFIIWLLRLPESPRWLLIHRRFAEAHDVLLGAAKFNGLIVDEKQAAVMGQKQKQMEQTKGTTATSNRSRNMLSAVDKIMAGKEPVIGGEKPTLLMQTDLDTLHGDRTDCIHKTTGHCTTCPRPSSSCSSSTMSFENDDSVEQQRKSLEPYTIEEFEIKFARLTESIAAKEFSKNEHRLNTSDLFKWPNLRKYTMILSLAWAANSFIYYGIVLRVGDLGGTNLFISFTLAGLTELPSIAFTIVCMKFLPRKTTNIFFFGMILLLSALQVPIQYYELNSLQQITMMLAKLFNSCSFTCILYQTMELFPTSIRQTAYSSCSLAGRIGSILAPFIKELAQMTNNLVPPIIYALLSALEFLLIQRLPETQGSDLPDTLIEAERFKGTDKKKVQDEFAIVEGQMGDGRQTTRTLKLESA